MTQWMFYFDQERCIGCKTCTLACKEWNEGRRGDAKLSGFTDEDLEKLALPADWHAGKGPKAYDSDLNRRNTMKENWRRVTYSVYGHKAPDIQIIPLSMGCNHCSDPACVKACPTGAHHKRTEDGLVVINTDKCIGCGNCAKACPYGAPELDEKAHKMTKCDACLNRLEQGLQPICVEACPQRALEFGDIEELRKKHGNVDTIYPLPQPAATHPNLVIHAPLKHP